MSELKSFAWYYLLSWGAAFGGAARQGVLATTSTPRQKHLQQRSCSPCSLQSPLVCSIHSMPILQVTVVQSSLRIPCATRVVSQQLGPPRPPTPWARAGHPPCPKASTPKKPRQRQGRGPGARRTFGATCGKEVPRRAGSLFPIGCEHPSTPGSRRAGCKLPGVGTHTPHPAPARKGPMHHLPPSE